MKISVWGQSLFFVVLGALLVSSSGVMAEQGSVLAKINAAVEPFDNFPGGAVPQLTPKTVPALESYQGGEFRVLARKEFIRRFRCSVCHNIKPMLARDGALFTHSGVVINHGSGGNALVCLDCHHGSERDFLNDSQDRKIDFDHSYQLCGQCHFRQKRDWLGGAHGKRETYWAGERVVKNCTSCHNPHAPAFPTQMPATYSLPLDE